MSVDVCTCLSIWLCARCRDRFVQGGGGGRGESGLHSSVFVTACARAGK